MNEKPLRRLHYFNGQRLEAADFKEEQEYHIRTRRWLNKSLYSAGIARGLEVRSVSGNPMVTVSPGLALDNEGREIILLNEERLEVISFSGKDETRVEGNYLVIEYGEDAHGQGGSSCVQGNSQPMYIGTKPKFSWVPYIPLPGSNQIVLAQVELKPGCGEVEVIGRDKRPLVGAAISAAIRQFALEGEREVAFIPKNSFPQLVSPTNDTVNVVGKIYFHIRGTDPRSISLYLRSEKFSSLYYTELGSHAHDASTSIGSHEIDVSRFSHVHTLSKVMTDEERDEGKKWGEPGAVMGEDRKRSAHQHFLVAKVNKNNADNNLSKFSFALAGDQTNKDKSKKVQLVDDEVCDDKTWRIIYGGEHRHNLMMVDEIGNQLLDENGNPIPLATDNASSFQTIVLTHDQSSISSITDPSGVQFSSRTGAPLDYVDNLQVFIWRVQTPDPPRPEDNRTQEIIDQLVLFYPEWRQLTPTERKLGNGGAGHIFAIKGTGAIRLDFLEGLEFYEGEYCIEFRVKDGRTDANGGKIHYNLYIE